MEDMTWLVIQCVLVRPMDSGLEQNQPACVGAFFAVYFTFKIHSHDLPPAVIDCGNLTDPEDGQVTFTPGVVATIETGLGAIANYTCNDGYDLVGDVLRTCQATEQWAGAEPTCMRK